MANIANNLNAAALSIGKTVKTSSGSAVNIVICLVTVGSEQLFSFAVFNCPCAEKHNASQHIAEGVHIRTGQIYGSVYIIVPAIILFLLGCAMNLKIWKLMTGCYNRDLGASRGYLPGCVTLLEIFMQALVAPCAWVAISLLDGKYYACAKTLHPYDMTCKEVVKATSKTLRYTVEFEQQKQKSQIVGWVFIAVALFVGSSLYMAYRCCSKLTYHQRHYMKWYRDIEHKQFEEIAKEQLTAQAQENIKNFLSEKRLKFDWDKISTVFKFKRDKNSCALYSRLDKWNEDNPLPTSDDDENTTEAGNGITPPASNDQLTRHGGSEDAGFASADTIALQTMSSRSSNVSNAAAPSNGNANQSNSVATLSEPPSKTKYATCRSKTAQIKSNPKLKKKRTPTVSTATNTSVSITTPLLVNETGSTREDLANMEDTPC